MKLIIKIFGTLLLFSGISLLIKPEIIFSLIENRMGNSSLYIIAIVVRLVLGIVFIIAAKDSNYPLGIKFFGYFFIIAAIIFIFIGQEGFQDLITSLIPNVKPYAPVSGAASLAFDGFLIYAFLDKKEL